MYLLNARHLHIAPLPNVAAEALQQGDHRVCGDAAEMVLPLRKLVTELLGAPGTGSKPCLFCILVTSCIAISISQATQRPLPQKSYTRDLRKGGQSTIPGRVEIITCGKADIYSFQDEQSAFVVTHLEVKSPTRFLVASASRQRLFRPQHILINGFLQLACTN